MEGGFQAKLVEEWGNAVTAYTFDFSPITTLTNEQFDLLCTANPELKFERTLTGRLVIMPPTDGVTGKRNVELAADLVIWNRKTNLGVVFDSSTYFRLPGGGDRSPDVSWVEKFMWDILTPEEQCKFPPICPDFVLELLSPNDILTVTQRKMQEYLDCGTRLGWLINPEDKQVEIYRPGQATEVLHSPSTISGETVLPGFTLELDWIWG